MAHLVRPCPACFKGPPMGTICFSLQRFFLKSKLCLVSYAVSKLFEGLFRRKSCKELIAMCANSMDFYGWTKDAKFMETPANFQRVGIFFIRWITWLPTSPAS